MRRKANPDKIQYVSCVLLFELKSMVRCKKIKKPLILFFIFKNNKNIPVDNVLFVLVMNKITCFIFI